MEFRRFKLKKIAQLVALLLPLFNHAQEYVKQHEEVLFEFVTQKNKKLVIAKETSNEYLVYRYGTDEKVEFEYPTNKEDSYKKFMFSWYLRGGGVQNDGVDLNYLYFINGNYKYVVYQEYSAESGKTNCGIKVINTQTNKVTNIKAVPSSVKGFVGVLRDNERIIEGDELFH